MPQRRVSITTPFTHTPPMTLATNHKPLALCVEDDSDLVYLLKFILNREGFDVQEAADGDIAQKWLAAAESPPALIMLDVMLPHTDGFHLLNLIRARAGWANVPVIMLTARSQERDVVRALDSGASDYIVKPFKPEELRARIKRLLRKPS
jgi:DNA-binding response OmpR family regulator